MEIMIKHKFERLHSEINVAHDVLLITIMDFMNIVSKTMETRLKH